MFKEDAALFAARQVELAARARQRVALQLSVGIDLDDISAAGPDVRHRLAQRIARELRRMRQAGLKRHWSYDLNRHIALRQVHDQLAGVDRAAHRGQARQPKRKRGRLSATAP